MSEEVSKLFYINLKKSVSERFDIGRFMLWCGDNYDPLTSNVLREIKDLKLGGFYTVQGQDGRPDLLADVIYGDTQYWWILMQYNAFLEISDITNGLEVRYPSVGALEDLYFSLKLRQKKDE